MSLGHSESAPTKQDEKHSTPEHAGSGEQSARGLPYVLALQRAAGNRAVSRNLRTTPAIVIQRAGGAAPTVPVLPAKPPAPTRPVKQAASAPANKPVAKTPPSGPELPPKSAPVDVPDPGAPPTAPLTQMPTAQQPATGTDWIGMLSNSNLFKFAGEFSRMFPGYGAITGAAVDLVGGVSDWRSATAAGVSGNTRAVIAARDILSGIDGIVGHIDYCAQIAHAIAVPVPPAEALILPFNEFTTTVKTGVDGAVLVMDVVEDVMLATDKAGVTPDSVAAKKSLNAGAAGNTIQDGVSMIFDIVDACTGGADQSQAIQKGVKVAAAGEKLTKVFVSSAKGVLNAWLSMLTNKGASAVQRDAEPPGGADAGDLAMKAGKSLMVGAVSTELSTMETAYGICGQLMESSIDNYHNTLKGIDAAMTLANGGKNPAIRIAELSGEMQKEFDARSHTLQEVIAKTGTAQDKLASIDAFVADLRKTADKCVVPHFEPAKPPANESVLDEAVRLAKNAAMEVANTGLGELQSSASLAQAGLRRVADDLASERQKIATFLQSVQDAAKQEVADIQARLDIITKRMTKAKSFEEFAEALVDEAAKALGLADGFKPEDIKALYDELGPLFPQVRQVLAAAAA